MQNTIKRLREIKQEIKDLVSEASDMLHTQGRGLTYQRANSYWIPHILIALDEDHEFCGRSMHSLEDSIAELEDLIVSEDDDEDFFDDEDFEKEDNQG